MWVTSPLVEFRIKTLSVQVIQLSGASSIIGHHVDSGIMGAYSSYNWVPEMREALAKWYEWVNAVQKVKVKKSTSRLIIL